MAHEIADGMKHEPFTALCVLKGGYQFFGELMKNLRKLHHFSVFFNNSNFTNLEKIDIEFIRIKSYENSTSTNSLKLFGIENFESLQNKVKTKINLNFKRLF